jgi:hypothetical protein
MLPSLSFSSLEEKGKIQQRGQPGNKLWVMGLFQVKKIIASRLAGSRTERYHIYTE